MKSKGRGLWRSVAASLVVFALLFSVAVFVLNYVGSVSGEAQTEMVKNAVRNAVLTCYAVEGAYPDDLEYLREHYGLGYNEARYMVYYDAFASNVMPDIRVVERGRGSR